MSYLKISVILFFFFGINISSLFAQNQKVADSLFIIYQQKSVTGTEQLELLRELSFNEMGDKNKGLQYADELINLAKKSNDRKYLRMGYFLQGTKQGRLGNLDEALASYIKSTELAKEDKNLTAVGECYGAIADIYSGGKNHSTAMIYYNKAIITLRQANDSISLASAIFNAGDEFLRIKNYDSALLYFEEAKIIFDKVNYLAGKVYSLGNIGMVYASTGKNMLAEKNIDEAIKILEVTQDYYPICDYLTSLADVYVSRGEHQQALNYTLRSLQLAEKYGLKEQISDASKKLSTMYEKAGKINDAFRYFKMHISNRDSINNINNVQKMADLRTNFEVSQKQIEVNLLNEQKRNNRNLAISLGVILSLAIIILGILFNNNRNNKKAYHILNLHKQETEVQKTKAENALTELKSTQKQLIQTAKMASLGELTAGIAHEIQNPLNFVNNFSELSVEMLDELREVTVNKLAVSDKAEAYEIINVLAENFKKISDHGKRADSIVKGMLQHSKLSTGNKEPTDINALADEYLRLSYHGFRAKDKEFKANFEKNFDGSIGKIELVAQDIGRVLLNLYNNAFYAVNTKKKQVGNAFEPHIVVSTKKVENKVEISVKDNGIGIPKNIVDKILQPFFTTKPTGQGTGLGLSLSYDIIKTHGGELKVETIEGEYAEFIIQLPVKDQPIDLA